MRRRDERQPEGTARGIDEVSVGGAEIDANGRDIQRLTTPGHLKRDRTRVPGFAPAGPARVVLVVGIVLPLALFAALAAAVELYGRLPGDTRFQRLLTPIANLPLPDATDDYFDRSPTVGAALLAGLCLVLIVRRRVVEALFAVAAVGGLLVVEPFLKDAFERPPPTGSGNGWSFPSGTAMVTMACACWALLVVWPQLQRLRPLAVAIAAAFVVAYGLAIVYLRWHYASDVLAGWCLAVSWVALLWLGATALARRASRRHRST